MRSHDRIDCIEKELMRKFHAIACIHMDPVDTEDERVETLRQLVEAVLRISMNGWRCTISGWCSERRTPI